MKDVVMSCRMMLAIEAGRDAQNAPVVMKARVGKLITIKLVTEFGPLPANPTASGVPTIRPSKQSDMRRVGESYMRETS
jgi:hypothetical protein